MGGILSITALDWSNGTSFVITINYYMNLKVKIIIYFGKTIIESFCLWFTKSHTLYKVQTSYKYKHCQIVCPHFYLDM